MEGKVIIIKTAFKALKKCALFIVAFFFIITVVCFYLTSTYTPFYSGRVTVEIRNNSIRSIDQCYISYSESDDIFTIPEIKPFQRIIILLPTSSLSTKTDIYFNKGTSKYYLFTKYISKTEDAAIIKLSDEKVDVKYSKYCHMSDYISLRPYRVIDADGTDWDGIPPLRKVIFGI